MGYGVCVCLHWYFVRELHLSSLFDSSASKWRRTEHWSMMPSWKLSYAFYIYMCAGVKCIRGIIEDGEMMKRFFILILSCHIQFYAAIVSVSWYLVLLSFKILNFVGMMMACNWEYCWWAQILMYYLSVYLCNSLTFPEKFYLSV